MAYDYDALYAETPNALGAPTPKILKFFESYPNKSASVLDIGCGQGRNAIPLARMGYQVTGIDLSTAGITDLRKTAIANKLPIIGLVADLTDYSPEASLDILLVDRTLHMLDREARFALLERLLNKTGRSVVIADEPSNLPDMAQMLQAHRWSITYHNRGYLFAAKET